MAVSNLGATNELPETQIPAGYTKPVVATFTDWRYQRTLKLNVLKATVENASAVTTMTNIFTNATVGINKQIADIVNADFIASKTVTSFGKLIALTTNMVPDPANNVYLTTTADSYVCDVTLYIKSV